MTHSTSFDHGSRLILRMLILALVLGNGSTSWAQPPGGESLQPGDPAAVRRRAAGGALVGLAVGVVAGVVLTPAFRSAGAVTTMFDSLLFTFPLGFLAGAFVGTVNPELFEKVEGLGRRLRDRVTGNHPPRLAQPPREPSLPILPSPAGGALQGDTGISADLPSFDRLELGH